MALFARRLRHTFPSSSYLRNFSTVNLIRAPARPSAGRLGLYSPALLPSIQTPLSSPAVGRYCPVRCRTSGSSYSPLNDPSPNWSNRPPKETILLDGCDYEHWLVVLEFPKDPKPSEEEMVNAYVKTLATVLGSEDEAKKKIYALSTTTYTGFQCNIDEETSNKLKGLPGVLWVLPDSYLDVPNKDYGGDLFVDGKVIPRPQFRYSERQQGRNDRPRPRYDRRRDSMQIERREPPPVTRREPLQMDRRDNFQGDRRDGFPGGRRDTSQGERRDAFQGERRDTFQGERRDTVQMDRREPVQGGGQ